MRFLLLLALLSFSLLTRAQVSLELIDFASGFNLPVDLVHAGDERLFVVEKGGLIKVIDGDGNTLPDPFLDIDNKVNSFASERGLLGLAFHPDYANNGYFFVNYTNNSGDTHISRFSVSADPNKADTDSEVVLLSIDQPFSNHNGGCLRFGADGYLYIGTGDGGSGGDPINAGQDRQTLLGKMLRIDVDNGSPYSIPEDNPNLGPDAIPGIYAYGIRAAQGITNRSGTKDIWFSEHGTNQGDEINLLRPGANYGWPNITSGTWRSENYEPEALPNPQYTAPQHFWLQTVAPTGLTFYTGVEFPSWNGNLIVPGLSRGSLWRMVLEGDVIMIAEELFLDSHVRSRKVVQSPEGQLYLLTDEDNGKLIRITNQSYTDDQ